MLVDLPCIRIKGYKGLTYCNWKRTKIHIKMLIALSHKLTKMCVAIDSVFLLYNNYANRNMPTLLDISLNTHLHLEEVFSFER